ncbi:Non-Catalytic module family EXPN protein [Mycena sanguinolenta]|uniref:Non-Catalytic module family EXPN protein n=1 Tax=Mycena sanguinolenta TaxID=230812 RepID=A0A8H6XX36_9AGAR|nr:Non-Catalytic module family EXPN protein [Mycena sanguinolenta]
MRFSSPFTAVAAFLAVGVQANPIASPEANITARTTYFSGDATYYYPDGNYGACFSSGSARNQFEIVADNGNNIDVTIGDLCPGCATEQIDLSSGAFAALAPLSVGVIPVVWNFK